MEDITKKLTEMLDSPEGMSQLQNLADMFLKSSADSSSDKPEPKKPDMSSLLPADIGINEISTIMRLVNAMKNEGDDQTVALLNALKPHLSNERRKKVDSAIKLLKLYRLLPLIKEGGLFD